MAINKKLIHFKNKSKFNEELANNNINEASICFIQDTREIWTHGQLYNCASIPADQRTLAYAEYTGTSTTAEVDTKSGYFPETLTEGAAIAVKFEGSLTYITTLNVNGTGAKNVYYKGNSLTSGSISRYNTYLFVYDGSYYRIVGIDTDTHYTAKNVVTSSSTSKSNATATNGNVRLNLIENSAVRSTHKIVGTGATTVTSDSSGNITIDTTLPNYIVPFTEDDLYTWLNAVNDNDYFTSSALTDDLTNISNAITNNVPLVLQGSNAELFPVVGHVSSGFLSLHILTFCENEPTSWLLTYNITSSMGDIRKYSIVDYVTNTELASALTAKQDTLVSGETIKTINGASILGSGDIAIEGGGGNVYTWSVPADVTTGTVTPEEYAAIKEASQVYIEKDGVSYQAAKTDVGTQGMVALSVIIGMGDDSGNSLIYGLYFEIDPSFSFISNTFIMSNPTKTSQLTNDSNFVTYAEFEWDGSSEGTVTSEKFEELRNANIVIVKQQDGDMIAHACKTSGGAVIFYYSTTMNNETSSAMFIVMDHDYSWTCSTSQTTIPAAVTEATVSGWGFTKNTGTVTGVKINGNTQNPSNGVVDLGTVITEHQPLKTINGESIIGSGDITIESDPQIQADWDVYDSTNKAYIKNKPFGYARVNVAESGSYSASSPILWIEHKGTTYDIKNMSIGESVEINAGPPTNVVKTSDNTIILQTSGNYFASFPVTVITATPLAKEFIPDDFLDSVGVMDLITQTSADWAAEEQFKIKNRTHYANFTSLTAVGSYDLDELGIPDTVVVLYNDSYYTLHEGDNQISYGPPMLINLENRTLTIDASSYIDESYPLKIASSFTKLPDVFLNHSYYCTDFTLDDIKNKLSQGSSDVVIDYNALRKALQSDKLILIPYARKEDGYSGYIIPSAYVEDFVYMTIQEPAWSNQFYLEIGEPTLDTWTITEVDPATTASVKFLDTSIDSIMELFANGEYEITDIEVPSSISELLELKNDDITIQSYIIRGNSSIGEYSIPAFVRKEYLEGEGSAVHIHIMGASPSPNLFYPDNYNNNEYNYYLYIGFRDEFYAYRYKPSALGEYSKEVIALPDESVPIFSSEHLTLVPNVTYVFGEIEDFSIYDFDYSRPNCEYKFIFTTTDYAGGIMLPEFVLWANGTIPALQNNTTYELSIECTTLSDHIQPSFRAVLVSFKIPES